MALRRGLPGHTTQPAQPSLSRSLVRSDRRTRLIYGGTGARTSGPRGGGRGWWGLGGGRPRNKLEQAPGPGGRGDREAHPALRTRLAEHADDRERRRRDLYRRGGGARPAGE